ncbi:MAG: hypothetical protein GWN86_12960, partial [Desulfobacterales bacterium]|nr:hypothetical protein [Desulfobacterales bacterium]
MEAIGLPTRILTIAKPGTDKLFDHVFPQVRTPKEGWITIDAVGYPNHPMGWVAPHDRYAIWDHEGNLTGFGGLFPGRVGKDFKSMASVQLHGAQEVYEMSLAGCEPSRFSDYGLENCGMAGVDDEDPEDWSKYGLLDFGK